MPTPEQSRRLSGQRSTTAQSRSITEDQSFALQYSQIGLPLCPEYAAYLTLHLDSRDALSLAKLQSLAGSLDEEARQNDFRWVVVIGTGFDQWRHWSGESGLQVDKELFSGEEELLHILEKHHPPYAHTGGDLFFHIKASEQSVSEEIACRIMTDLDGTFDLAKSYCSIGDSLHAGRIYGGRMLHGLISSVDPVGLSARAIVGDEMPRHKGGCYALTQHFVHDWQQLTGMADSALENLIGRDHVGNIIMNDDERAHVKMVRVNDADGINYRHVAQSQPFRCHFQIERANGGGQSRYSLARLPVRPEVGPGKEEGVYQLSYTKNIVALTATMQNMIGPDKGYVRCRHLNYSHADQGSFFYVPSAPELGLPAPNRALMTPMNVFFDVRSTNGYLFYNTKDYLHQLGHRTDRVRELEPLPTDRVVELLGYTFSRWHDTWYRRRPAPELGHLEEYLEDDERDALELSIAERKGVAVKKTLALLSSDDPGRSFDTFRLHPKELIVGSVPDYTLGSGFEVMKYLNAEESTEAFLLKVSEGGAAGHNVPNYHRLLELGVGGLLADFEDRLGSACDSQAREFFLSCVHAYEGVQTYLKNYADLTRRTLQAMRHGSESDRRNLEAIADRLDRLVTDPPSSFLDAAQLVFSMHCCMHIGGESVSIGRLDQLLQPFLCADLDAAAISQDQAQEIIDCFWIKMDEKALLNHRHMNDRLTRGAGAITYEGGDFPQGAAINQWVQQVTVGGYKANDATEPEDACNDVTRMCLRAARRLPMNAPCLSLRVNPKTPPDVIEEATKAILSGGAHPFLINDDKIVAGLIRSGEGVRDGGSIVDVADARDMVCDGCFESLLAGKNEFAFSYVPVPDAIEMALNRGSTYAAAGPVHLRGLKASFRSKPADGIKDWDEFYAIFREHYRFKLIDFYDGMLSRYGNLNKACPSPLLSPLVDGCLDSGRDMTSGGARYKLLAPLMNGIATAIDSLWAIRTLVFSDEAVFTLPELVNCLICDWGYDMKEPFYSESIGEDRLAVEAERFKNLRMHALSLPKFGQGNEAVDHFARELLQDLVDLAYDLIRNPKGIIAEKLDSVRQRFSTNGNPFDFVITPGIATFEDYAGVGSFLGASADGRRNCQTVASDCSPAPTPPDLPVPEHGRPAIHSLRAWAADSRDPTLDPIGVGLSNGSPVDVNIREHFPFDQLQDLIWKFARGEIGSNMMSITCADTQIMRDAQKTPERYDLLRMRMGGWSEFFVAMFPHHQEQHLRRPLFEAD